MNYLIVGASRGLGAFFNRALPSAGDTVWLVSRSQPNLSGADGVERIWIQADLSERYVASQIAEAIGDVALDVCLYNAGIWESDAFSVQYDYEQVPEDETERVIRVNMLSAMTCVQKLLPALRRSDNAKIIFIGSNAGLEHSRRPEVAYAASKFALRGVAHSLREVVRQDRIAVTCLNLGDVGTVVAEGDDFAVHTASQQDLIAPADIVIMLKALIAMSNTSCVKEIDMLAMSEQM
jgi:short-subunit dehydrogenase